MTRALPLLTALLVALVASPAQAITGPLKTVLETSLQAPAGTTSTACHTGLRPGAAGVATERAYVSGLGAIDVALDAAQGDWDVAVFDVTGALVAADASADAQEVAAGWLRSAGPVTVQACRLSGSAAEAAVVLKHAPLTGDIPAKIAAAKADPPQLVDVLTPTAADKAKVQELDLDLTEHGHEGSMGVVLHGEADRKKLRAAGLGWTVEVADIVARDQRARLAEARTARSSARALPSGERTTYRTLADFNAELKKLADENKDIVKLITLPHKTFLGKDVMGVEITTDVNTANGKPAFLNMGVHHAREWPSGEHAIEWAYELVKGFRAGDARVKKIVEGSRNIVVPIVNPDGFEASRTAGERTGGSGGRDEQVDDLVYILAGTANGGEYRRKNCRLPNSDSGNCLTAAGLAATGVDPNRNYGGLWGGPGASGDVTNETYWGPGPFSEPETKNVRDLVAANSVVTLITNHTTAGLVLRAPGLASLGAPVDEDRGYKALGDAMALENGYFSQSSFELYDTTGTTEDWTYNTAGGFGFTFEVYCGAPNYATGDCDDPAFHPTYKAGVIDEYDGSSPQSDHDTDPGRSAENPFGNVAKYDGRGNREAYFIAAESTLDEARHSVIEGKAPAGVTLRVKKTFKTETFPQGDGPDAKPILFDDKLEQTLSVPASGSFRWHLNPSTRPIVAKERGSKETGAASPAEERTGGPQGTGEEGDDGAAVPGGDAACTTPANCNEHAFTVPAGAGILNKSVTVRAEWASLASDWDMELFTDLNANQVVDAGDTVVSVSQQGTTDFEQVDLPTEGGRSYIARLTNFAAVEPYDLSIAYRGPEPFSPAQVEAWTLTCEKDGKVLETQQVIVDRGKVAPVTLGGCEKALAGTPASPSTPATPGASGTPGAPGKPAASSTRPCTAGSGLARASVTPAGSGARLVFKRGQRRPVTVSVFQQSRGRQVTGERLVARFSGRSTSVKWNGRANRPGRTVTDGIYFVRYTMRLADGSTDALRVTLLRREGRFSRLASFYRRASCDALPSFKLERPVFGGRTNRALNISFRLADPARVTVTVLKGTRVVKRFGPTQRRAGVTHRLRLGASKLARGTYTVRIQVPGAKPVTATLVARNL